MEGDGLELGKFDRELLKFLAFEQCVISAIQMFWLDWIRQTWMEKMERMA